MPEAEETPQKPAKQAKSRMIIWILVLVAFAVIAVVFVKSMFLKPAKVPAATPTSTEETTTAVIPGDVIRLGEGDFLTNLAKPDQEAFFSVRIAFELDAERGGKESMEISEEVNSREYELREVVEQVLMSRNREDLSTEAGIEGVRKEIIRKINARLLKGKIRKVYLTNMIIQ